MKRQALKSFAILMLLCSLTACAAKPKPAEIVVPQVVKQSPCPRTYGQDLPLDLWVEGPHLGSMENGTVSNYNVLELLNELRLRDAVIDCYEAKIK